MFNQDEAKSGFDFEILLSENYVSYILLSLVEEGEIPLNINLEIEGSITTVNLTISLGTDVIRLYEPNLEGFEDVPTTDKMFRIRFIDSEISNMAVDLNLSYSYVEDGETKSGNSEITMNFFMSLISPSITNSSDLILTIELIEIPLLSLLFSEEAVANILIEIKSRLDRSIEKSISGGTLRTIEKLEYKFYPSSEGIQQAIGIYFNLHLRTSEEDYLADRGNIADALNFLPIGNDIAVSLPGRIYSDIQRDINVDFATSDNSIFRILFKLIEKEKPDLRDIDFKFYPEKIITDVGGIATEIYTNKMVLYMALDIDDAFDNNAKLTFLPERGELNSIRLSSDVDFNLGLLGLLLDLAGGVIGILLAPSGIGAAVTGFVVGTIATALIQALIIELNIDNIKGSSLSNMLQLFILRLSTSTRYWDPFFYTSHQVVALVEENDILFNNKGISFTGKAAIGRDTTFFENIHFHQALRNEEDEITGYRFRFDFGEDLDATYDFDTFSTFNALGIWRLPFSIFFNQEEDGKRIYYIDLTKEQLIERHNQGLISMFSGAEYFVNCIEKENGNNIKYIGLYSRFEYLVAEQKLTTDYQLDQPQVIITEFEESNRREQLRQQFIEENEREPTDAELESLFVNAVQQLFNERFNNYKNNELEQDIKSYLNNRITFKLTPNELGQLEVAGIIKLNEDQLRRIFVRKNNEYYYRTFADVSPKDLSDNLVNWQTCLPPENLI